MDGIVIGSTIKKKFITALLAGFLIFGTVTAMLGFTGTLFALPLGGMGDFYVTFDKLEGNGFILHPKIGETGNQDKAPLVRNKIDTATIDNLRIYKDLKMPTGKWIRINITANQPTTIEGLMQDARFIDANLSFSELAIEETNTSQMAAEEVLQKNWTQDAESIMITNAKIVTDYLFQNMVSLGGAKIYLENIQEPELMDTRPADNANKPNGTFTAVRSDDGSGGNEKNSLPHTASQLFLPIVIGTALILLGMIVKTVSMSKGE